MCCYYCGGVETFSSRVSIRNRICSALGADMNNICDIYADDNRQCHGQCAAVFLTDYCSLFILDPMLLSGRGPTQPHLEAPGGVLYKE